MKAYGLLLLVAMSASAQTDCKVGIQPSSGIYYCEKGEWVKQSEKTLEQRLTDIEARLDKLEHPTWMAPESGVLTVVPNDMLPNWVKPTDNLNYQPLPSQNPYTPTEYTFPSTCAAVRTETQLIVHCKEKP